MTEDHNQSSPETAVDEDNLAGEIWSIAVKLRGLGEVLSMAKGEPPFNEEALKGLGYLILEQADKLDSISDAIKS